MPFEIPVGGFQPLVTGTQRIWVKVRRVGKGGACISLTSAASIRPECLTDKRLVLGPPPFWPGKTVRYDALGVTRLALSQRFGLKIPFPKLAPSGCYGIDGYHECFFMSAVTGTASVLFRPSGPTIIFTSLDCQGAYAGRPECAIT